MGRAYVRAGYILYPVTDAILPLSVHRIFLSLSLSSTSPLRQMSSASSAAFLLWSILAVIVRKDRSKTCDHQLIHPRAFPAHFTPTVPRFPHSTSLEL